MSEQNKPSMLHIRVPRFEVEELTEQQKSALELLDTALIALAAAELYLHATEETLHIDKYSHSFAQWDSVARIDRYGRSDFYSYHLSDEQEELANTLKNFKKLLGKDDE